MQPSVFYVFWTVEHDFFVEIGSDVCYRWHCYKQLSTYSKDLRKAGYRRAGYNSHEKLVKMECGEKKIDSKLNIKCVFIFALGEFLEKKNKSDVRLT